MKSSAKREQIMRLTVDTREQLPYTFEAIKPVIPRVIERGTLPTGDYASTRSSGPGAGPYERDLHECGGLPHLIAIVERKTLSDLYRSLSEGRDRLKKLFNRMRNFGYAAIVIEAEMSAIMDPNAHLAHPTKMSPKSVMSTLIAWSQRFGVQVFMCPGRAAGEAITYRILERWIRDDSR